MTTDECYTTTFCPQCGWDVKVDEDGCCASCGALATGEAVEQIASLRQQLEQATQDRDLHAADAVALRSRVERLVQEVELLTKRLAKKRNPACSFTWDLALRA